MTVKSQLSLVDSLVASIRCRFVVSGHSSSRHAHCNENKGCQKKSEETAYISRLLRKYSSSITQCYNCRVIKACTYIIVFLLGNSFKTGFETWYGLINESQKSIWYSWHHICNLDSIKKFFRNKVFIEMQFKLCFSRFYSRYLRKDIARGKITYYSSIHSKMIQEEIDTLTEAFRNV